MIPIESKGDLKKYFDSIPDQIIVLDGALDVQIVNEAADRHAGDGIIEGRPLDAAFMKSKYGEGIARLFTAIGAARDSGTQDRFEIQCECTPEGRPFSGFEVSVHRLGKDCGEGVVIHMHDITMRCKTRRDMDRQNKYLAEMVRINHTIIEIMSALQIGETLDEIFEIVFSELAKVIPYDRIGLSLLDETGEQISVVKAKSGNPIKLDKGFSCKLEYTTLGKVLDKTQSISNDLMLVEGGKKRIIFDLEKYVAASGRMTPYNKQLLAEGVRSSIAVPLYVAGRPTALIFFSSRQPNVYTRRHLGEDYDTCMHLLDSVQAQLALALEKGITISHLQETNQRLKELISMKDDFLSIASHDLRSPLTTIIGFARLLLDKTQVTDMQHRSLDIMANSAGHLLILVDDMLALAKANSGKMELNLERVNVREVLEQSLAAMSFNAQNKNINIVREEAQCYDMMLDRSKIFQVFNNLIGNAIKFSPDGGTLVIRESVAESQYGFSVTDSGAGISEADQEKLFGKFVQVGNDLATNEKGSGLGLLICKMIVEKHGGSIGVQSAPGQGSTFHFTIPLKKPDDPRP